MAQGGPRKRGEGKEEVVNISSERELKEYAKELASELKAGDVIALEGNLGTGKTTLTKYIAKALEVEETITSPTFNIVKEYRSGKLPLFHFDVYRIVDPEEMYEIGYEEYFYGDGVSVVEWADMIEELIPENAIKIKIEYGDDENSRRIIRKG